MWSRSETGFDALGKGVEEGKPPVPAQGPPRFVSRGLTRSRTDKLVVMPGGGDALARPCGRGSGAGTGSATSSNVTSLATAGARAHSGAVEGATALKPERAPSPTEALENLPWSPAKTEPAPTPRRSPPRAAPKPRRAATRARPAGSAGTSRWCGMGPA